MAKTMDIESTDNKPKSTKIHKLTLTCCEIRQKFTY